MGLRDNYEEASQRLVFELRQHRLGSVTLDRLPKENKDDQN